MSGPVDQLAPDPMIRANKPRLTPKQIHDITMKVLAIAANADGVDLPSRTLDSLHAILRRVGQLVEAAEQRVVLASLRRPDTGDVIIDFTAQNFAEVDLYDALTAVCARHKRLLRSRRNYSRLAFARDIVAAYNEVGREMDEKIALEDAAELEMYQGKKSPSEMAGSLMENYGLRGTRTMQNRKRLSRDARLTQAQHDHSALAVTREFLACLQVPKDRVAEWAQAIWLSRGVAGELRFRPLRKEAPTRRYKRRGRDSEHYALRDACPVPSWLSRQVQDEPDRERTRD